MTDISEKHKTNSKTGIYDLDVQTEFCQPVTIAVPEHTLEKLIAAAKECSGDLEGSIRDLYHVNETREFLIRRMKRDLEPVNRLNKALEAINIYLGDDNG